MVEAIGAFPPLLLFGGGERKVVFLCFLHYPDCYGFALFDYWFFTGTVVMPETTQAAVRLEEVIVDCSEMTAFLASGNEIPRSTFICCTFFQVSISGILVKKQHVYPSSLRC